MESKEVSSYVKSARDKMLADIVKKAMKYKDVHQAISYVTRRFEDTSDFKNNDLTVGCVLLQYARALKNNQFHKETEIVYSHINQYFPQYLTGRLTYAYYCAEYQEDFKKGAGIIEGIEDFRNELFLWLPYCRMLEKIDLENAIQEYKNLYATAKRLKSRNIAIKRISYFSILHAYTLALARYANDPEEATLPYLTEIGKDFPQEEAKTRIEYAYILETIHTLYEEALAQLFIAEKVMKERKAAPKEFVNLYHLIGSVYLEKGELKKAEKVLKIGIDIDKKLQNPDKHTKNIYTNKKPPIPPIKPSNPPTSKTNYKLIFNEKTNIFEQLFEELVQKALENKKIASFRQSYDKLQYFVQAGVYKTAVEKLDELIEDMEQYKNNLNAEIKRLKQDEMILAMQNQLLIQDVTVKIKSKRVTEPSVSCEKNLPIHDEENQKSTCLDTPSPENLPTLANNFPKNITPPPLSDNNKFAFFSSTTSDSNIQPKSINPCLLLLFTSSVITILLLLLTQYLSVPNENDTIRFRKI